MMGMKKLMPQTAVIPQFSVYFIIPIFKISDNRMSCFRKMSSDLMRFSSNQFHLKERIALVYAQGAADGFNIASL